MKWRIKVIGNISYQAQADRGAIQGRPRAEKPRKGPTDLEWTERRRPFANTTSPRHFAAKNSIRSPGGSPCCSSSPATGCAAPLSTYDLHRPVVWRHPTTRTLWYWLIVGTWRRSWTEGVL